MVDGRSERLRFGQEGKAPASASLAVILSAGLPRIVSGWSARALLSGRGIVEGGMLASVGVGSGMASHWRVRAMLLMTIDGGGERWRGWPQTGQGLSFAMSFADENCPGSSRGCPAIATW
jgi:hypothetical protein